MKILEEKNSLYKEEIWDIIKAKDLFNVYIESIINGGILEILISNKNYNYRYIVYNEFKNICNYISYGYKTSNYNLMKKSIIKLSELYDFINNNKIKVKL